jgi:hypothetical protein
MNHADENRTPELARNVAIALRFKKSQGTPEMPQVEKEVLAPAYNRVRGGSFHLADNARNQDFPHPGMYLRAAFPDRVDIMEEVIAEGDRVGLLFRVTGTHTGNFFGIAPTGRKNRRPRDCAVAHREWPDGRRLVHDGRDGAPEAARRETPAAQGRQYRRTPCAEIGRGRRRLRATARVSA